MIKAHQTIARIYPLSPSRKAVAELLGVSVSYVDNIVQRTIPTDRIGGQDILLIGGLTCKLCTKCGDVQELDRFQSITSTRSGKDNYCITCRRKYYAGAPKRKRESGNSKADKIVLERWWRDYGMQAPDKAG